MKSHMSIIPTQEIVSSTASTELTTQTFPQVAKGDTSECNFYLMYSSVTDYPQKSE